VEHRAWTVIFHRLRSLTWTLAASQVRLTACSSLSRLLLHVCFGRPRFLLPCGFHASACLVMLEGSFSQGVANPSPFSSPDLYGYWLLICPWPQVGIWHSVIPLEKEDMSEALGLLVCRRYQRPSQRQWSKCREKSAILWSAPQWLVRLRFDLCRNVLFWIRLVHLDVYGQWVPSSSPTWCEWEPY